MIKKNLTALFKERLNGLREWVVNKFRSSNRIVGDPVLARDHDVIDSGSRELRPEMVESKRSPEPGTMTAAAPVEQPIPEVRVIPATPPEDRLARFRKEDPRTTLADIKYSANVHTSDFQRWRRGKLKPDSVMSERIEDVLSGALPLMKKPHKLRRD